MRRIPAAVLLAASILAVTSSAQAKAPPSGFKVCGPAACATIDAFGDAEPLAINLFYGGDGSETLWTPKLPAGSFYAVHWSFQQGEAHTGYYVPLLNAFRYTKPAQDPASYLRLWSVGRQGERKAFNSFARPGPLSETTPCHRFRAVPKETGETYETKK